MVKDITYDAPCQNQLTHQNYYYIIVTITGRNEAVSLNLDEMARELFSYMRVFQKGPVRRAQELSQGEMAMLAYLTFEESEVTPTELSNHFNLSTARVANTLNSLEKKRYIERIHDSIDRRKVIVHITDTGRQFSKKKMEETVEDLSDMLNDLGEEDAADFLRIMRKISFLTCEKQKEELLKLDGVDESQLLAGIHYTI